MSIINILSASSGHSNLNVISEFEKELDSLFNDLNREEYNIEMYGGDKKKGFHPSSLSTSTCKRKIYMDYMGLSGDVGNRLRRIFDNGHDVHDRWQKYLTRSGKIGSQFKLWGNWRCKKCNKLFEEQFEPECCGKVKYAEVPLADKERDIVGKADGILVFHGVRYLLEIKSINSAGFSKLNSAKKEHRKQAMIYARTLGVETILFLYEDKNTQNMKLFLDKVDHSLLKEVDDMRDEVELIIKSGQIPGGIFPSRFCDWCHPEKFGCNQGSFDLFGGKQ